MDAEAAKQEDRLTTSSYVVRSWDAYNLPGEHINLVRAKWLRSLRHGNKLFKLVDPSAFYPAYHSFIERLLRSPDCVVRLAILTDDPDVILGFSVARGPILDYVYVHTDMRRQGIGRKLVPQGVTTLTHITNSGHSFWKKHFNSWKFNPFI